MKQMYILECSHVTREFLDLFDCGNDTYQFVDVQYWEDGHAEDEEEYPYVTIKGFKELIKRAREYGLPEDATEFLVEVSW